MTKHDAAGLQPVGFDPVGVEIDDPMANTAELVARHGTKVQNFCGRMTNWHPDADDLAQDVFVVAIERRGTFRGGSTVETWLLGIAIRLCRRWLRRRAVRNRMLGWFAREANPQTCPRQSRYEDADQIAAGLAKIETRHREILVLRYLQDRSVEDVAEILNITRSAADQRLSRARRRFAKWFEDQQNDSSPIPQATASRDRASAIHPSGGETP